MALIQTDTSAVLSFTSSGGGGSVSFTVGNNPNRVLVVYVGDMNNGANPTATYAGVSMTGVDTVSQSSGGAGTKSFILVAPATGTNSIAFSGMSNGFPVKVTAHSYYNCAQLSQPDNHTGGQYSTSANPGLTPTQNNCLFWAAGYGDGGNGSLSATGLPNNQQTSAQFSNPVFIKIFAGDNGVISPASAQSPTITDASGTRMVGVSMSIAPLPASGNSNFLSFFPI